MAESTHKKTLREAALDYASRGLHVFPCAPGAKEPALKGGHGVDDATTNSSIIEAWWNQNPNYNIGIAPACSRHCVLDADPPRGMDTLASLEMEHGLLPPTWIVKTPRGGFHYWFVGDLPSTVQKLGPKLDTRGRGGYVLAPPSVVNGVEYEHASDGAIQGIATLPEWIGVRLADRSRELIRAGDSVSFDLPGAVARATELLRGYVSKGDTAVEGQGGDARTYALAAEVLGLGLSPEVAFELLRDEWNPHCVPPWEEDELAQKCLNAANYAQNDPGAWAVLPARELFPLSLLDEAQSSRAGLSTLPGSIVNFSRFYPRDETEQESRPEPRWLIPNLLPAEGTAMIYGPPGSYKSFLALDMALSLAAGIPAYGHTPEAPVAAVYVAAEGAIGLERLRRPAWRMGHQVEHPLPFYTVDTMPLVVRPQDYLDLIEQIEKRGIKPGLLVLDTTARALGGMNENDARDVGQFIETVEHLKRTLRCTVLAVHHTGKDGERGARGSSAFLAGLDTGLEVRAHEASKTVELHVRRQKDAEAKTVPWTFQGRTVGPSLVFFEIGTNEHRRLVRADDAFEPAKIGRVLRELGAVGEDRAVTSQVLAAHLTPPLENDTLESQTRATDHTRRQLRRLARGPLAGYALHGAKDFRWCLPAE